MFLLILAMIFQLGLGNDLTSSTFAAAVDPVITATPGSASFVAGDNTASTPVIIDSGLTVTDGVSTTLESATVAITGNFHAGEDVLGFFNDGATVGNISASYNAATGLLTLTSAGATETLAQWQSALRSVTYTNTAIWPNTATRTISFSAIDGASNTSNTTTRTVTVTATDQTPIVTITGGTTAYISGTSAVTIDSGVTVSDLDNTTLSSATVSIGAGYKSGDTILFINTSSVLYGNIVASYNTATGVLTLVSAGATATLAQWSNALSTVTFSTGSTTTGNRTISYTVSDGAKTSAASTKTVNVIGPPNLTASSGSASFVAGDNTPSTPVVIDSGLTVTDGISATLASASVAITGNFQSGEDVLAFTNDGATMGNITASYNAATGVLKLTSAGATATLAQWQSALRSVAYTDTAITPNTATRAISFSAIDGAGNSSNTTTRTVTVAATNQTPVVSLSSGPAIFRTGDLLTSTPVAIDNGLTINDLDNATLASATVNVSSHYSDQEDVLAFANDNASAYGNITASYSSANGELTMTSAGAAATLAQWQNALRAVTYNNIAATPDTAARTISFTVNDGTSNSNRVTKSMTLIALSSLSASTNAISVLAGQTATTAITAKYSDLTQADVTSNVSWSVRNSAIASVSNGTITGLQAGSTVITAVYGTRSIDINVTVSSVSISGPVTNPAAKIFYDFVSMDRLKASIQNALNAGNSASFQDTASHWASKDLSLGAKLGIINGYPDGSFRPDASVTRAEFSTLVVKAFALRLENGGKEFEDTQTSWARDSIGILAYYGVIGGYPDGTFHPDQKITRAEMVAILSKILILQSNSGEANTFIDVTPQHWAKTMIEEAAAAGIIQGKGEKRFAPDDNLTRAEALTVILRVMKQDPVISSLLV
ncbi:S-layer homology domain-containing protein [Paenibacillus glycanilyticus]|uniref:S-layer homology domain-containing protein n=1 Tax=Paenibacillus glycanilyticus TaxID=126569 RepID=UPI001F165FAC|nr:S-layer homology domain-containing protein [Paenibacillus glycanilyticus]